MINTRQITALAIDTLIYFYGNQTDIFTIYFFIATQSPAIYSGALGLFMSVIIRKITYYFKSGIGGILTNST